MWQSLSCWPAVSAFVPNRGKCWPDSVISVGEGRVKGGGLRWRKGRKGVAAPSILFSSCLAHCGMLGEDAGSIVACVIKSVYVCVGTDVRLGRQGEFMCPCLEGRKIYT